MATDTGNHRSAAWGGIALMVLATILLVMTSLGYWLKSTILDSDEFSSKVEDVLSRPEAAERIGDVLAEQALSSGEIQDRIAAELPENASFVPALLDAPLSDVTGRALARIFMLDATQEVIATAIRELHSLVVSTLEGRRDGVQVEGGSLVLHLEGVASNFLDKLGINAPQGGGDRELGTVVLVKDAKALDQASRIVRAIDEAVPFLLVGSVVAFGGAVALYRDKSRGVVVVGYAIIIAGVASLLAWRFSIWGSSAFLEEAPVARMIIDSLASNLKEQSIALVVLGAAVVILADERIRGCLSSHAGKAKTGIEAFGVGRTILVAAAGVTVLSLIT